MTIHLPKDQESRVEAAVETDRFEPIHDAMADAARLLPSDVERARPAAIADAY